MKQSDHLKTRLVRYFWYILAVVLFGPFAVILGLAFLGFDSPSLLGNIPAFGTWFMASLAVCGVITCITTAIEAVRNRHFGDLGCLLVLVPFTALWVWILFK